MIHLIVHHRQDPKQPWPNVWQNDDHTVQTIMTTQAIANACQLAKQQGQRVRFHRCQLGSAPAVVCAEADVANIVRVDGRTYLVQFARHSLLNEPPPRAPFQGMRSYEAEPPASSRPLEPSQPEVARRAFRIRRASET